ncbi:MAG: hypothetical protein U0325_03995 [Polyangiales bacterium]
MATQVFFFAPEGALPIEADAAWESTVQSWLSLTTDAWMARWRALPEAEQARVPHYVGGTGLSKNAAAATRCHDKTLRDSARAWVDAAWARYEASGRTVLPEADVAACHAALGIPSKVAVNDLLNYRGAARAIAPRALPPGAKLGFFRHHARADEFDLAASDATERAVACEIVRAAGGELLALWTYGHAVVLMRFTRDARGAVEVQGPHALRVEGVRDAAALARLRGLVEGGAIALPWRAFTDAGVEGQMDVPTLFAALGAPRAPEILPVDAAGVWSAFDGLCASLLAEAEADKAHVRRVQAAVGTDLKIPAKPDRGLKKTPGALANVAARLALHLGPRGDDGGHATLPPAREPAPGWVVDRMRCARETLDRAAAPTPIGSWRALQEVLPPRLAYDGRLDESQGGFVSLRVTVEGAAARRALREDLLGRHLVDSYGTAWIEGDGVLAYACARVERDVLIAALADLPAGSTLALACGPDVLGRWVRVAPSA